MNKDVNIKSLIRLFLSFLKVGAFTFGGGYAMLPLIEEETVKKRGWIKDEDILDIVAVSESTPGPIAINMATFVGYKVCGVLGSVFATLGVVLPSFIIILIISFFFRQFQDIKVVKFAFNGIRAGVVALLIKALLTMSKQCPRNIISYIILIVSFILASFFGVNVLIIIIVSAIVGLLYSYLVEKRGESK